MEAVPGRVHFGDCEYTVGDSARRCGKYFTRNVDDYASKIDLALPMLLGALAFLPPRKEWNLYLTASIHDFDNLGKKLTETLSGEHDCILSGNRSKVNVTILKVLPEGMGALVNKQLPEKLTVIDFGNGTTLLSRYSAGKREAHDPEPCGVEALIDLISKQMKSINDGLPGDRHLIRMGLESGQLNYGRSQSFKAIYKKCLQAWYEKNLKKVVKQAKNNYDQGDEVWCLGGGCLLPGFKETLNRTGFKVHESPIDANVQGLLAVSQKLIKVALV